MQLLVQLLGDQAMTLHPRDLGFLEGRAKFSSEFSLGQDGPLFLLSLVSLYTWLQTSEWKEDHMLRKALQGNVKLIKIPAPLHFLISGGPFFSTHTHTVIQYIFPP